MCGLLGWASRETLDVHRVRKALSCLRHRGPDDEGILWDAEHRLALGHRRLSVIDLSSAGRQPMSNEDRTLWVVYNGEIYNHPELREELRAKGHSFISKTDTEVLLHLYEEEGEDMVDRLVGMFAFAIYDQPRHRLFLVRDRLGIKPLYYADYHGSFLFASEIKAILATEAVPSEVDWQAISDYFTFLFVPHPRTAFRHIRQLPPACTLTYDLSSNAFSIRRYWTPWNQEGDARHPLSRGELKDRLRSLLSDSVRGELISDVPLGIFFSGGIDSTLLAALMTRTGSKEIKTFTIGFSGEAGAFNDDLPYARLASRFFGAEHHEFLIEPPSMEALLDMVRCFDQPFANPTFYIQHLIARQARQFVTVALSGVGGDELFGGYPKYRLFPWSGWLRQLPAGLASPMRELLGLLPEPLWNPVLRRTKRVLKGAGYPFGDQYVRWCYYFTEEEKRQLLRGPLASPSICPASRILADLIDDLPQGIDIYGALFYAELQLFLAGNLLEYTDKTTMAVALETRVPFLDHRLVEFCARIPFRDKIRWGQSRVILRETFSDLIPPVIASAPKRGFSPPLAQWMETAFDRYFDRVLTREVAQKEGLFHWDAIQRLRQQHRLHQRDASMELLAILMFDVWFRRYIQSAPSPLEAIR